MNNSKSTFSNLRATLWRWLPLIIGIVIASLLQLTGSDDEELGFAFSTAPLSYPRITLKKQDVSIKINATGRVRAKQYASLNAEVQGRILHLSPELITGVPVKKGQLLVQIENLDYSWQLASARQQLAQAQLELQQASSMQAQALEDLARRNTVSPSALAQHKPQMDLAQAKVEQAQVQIQVAQRNIERTAIHAPFDGHILNRFANQGEFVQTGSALLSLAQTEQLYVDIHLSKGQMSSLMLAEQATATATHGLPLLSIQVSEYWGNRHIQLPAKVVASAPEIDPKSNMQKLTLAINPVTTESTAPRNSANAMADIANIKSGSLVNTTILVAQLSSVFSVAKHHVSADQRLPVIHQDGSVKYVPLQIVFADYDKLYFTLDSDQQAIDIALIPHTDHSEVEHNSTSLTTIAQQVEQPHEL